MEKLKCGISGNTIKIIALITMTIDHIGLILFPGRIVFRIIGRISFPLFAYMIAEGCRYTKNKKKHFLTVFLLGLACQIVYYAAERSLYQCILISFSISILIIYSLLWAKDKSEKSHINGETRLFVYYALPMILLAAAYFVSEILPTLLTGTDFGIDYGFGGILLPVMLVMSDNKKVKNILFAVGLVILCLLLNVNVQWFCLLSIIPILLYNGKRGKRKLKYLFYIYYPAHLAALYLIAMLIS